MRIGFFRFWLGSVVVLFGSLSVAQVPALPGLDAREQQLQQERERALRDQQAPKADVRLTPSAADPGRRLPQDESPCFPIARIELSGPQADKFLWAIDAADPPEDLARGRCLGAQGINLVMARIQNAIVERGYITTRILAGNQDLKSGALKLTLVPGLVHAIRFAPGSEGQVHAANALPVGEGDLLNLRDIEQGLENFKRVPTIEADIQIVPAEGGAAVAGESDVVISWRQSRRWRLNLSADDGGSRSTGKYQSTATVSLDNPLALSDLFYVSYNRALAPLNSDGRSTDGYTLYYSVPIGYWSISASTSSSSYFQTVAGLNQPYRYSGESDNAELRLTRMLWRDATSKTSASVRGWQRTSSNFIDDTEVLVQQRNAAGWGADINHRHFFGASTFDVTIDYRKGTGAFNAMEAPEQAFGEGTSRMRLWSMNAQLDFPFSVKGQAFRYATSWRQQWNETPLSPQDRLSIGNRYTVRGFDGELTLMGERGFVWRNELASGWQALATEAYAALDYGKTAGFPTADQAGRDLAGGGIGLRGAGLGTGYEFFIGVPIHKPKGFETADFTATFNLNWSY